MGYLGAIGLYRGYIQVLSAWDLRLQGNVLGAGLREQHAGNAASWKH